MTVRCQTKHALLALAVVLAIGTASMADSIADAIKDRQQAMKDIGGAMQNLASIAKKEAPFDSGVVKSNADTIAKALKRSAVLFPEGSITGDVETWAMPGIWSELADFEKKFEMAEAEAVALQSVTSESEFPPALGKLGNACKACHQTYRRPKE
jgi:cytochrome c556